MKTYPAKRPRKARHPRVPAFLPVPGRARRDGLTPERQARFLAQLAVTRSVSAAARKVGMARESAYRLRARPGAASFRDAWDRTMGRAPGKRKVTTEERLARALGGLIRPHIYRGTCTAIVRKADNTALLAYLAACDRVDREEDNEIGRSQSFGGPEACHDAPDQPPLPRRAGAPISLSRRAYFASQRQGPP